MESDLWSLRYFILFQFLEVESYYMEKSVSPAWLLLEIHFAFFYNIQADFFPLVSRLWAFYVVGKHVIFICFFPPSGA